MIDVSLFFDKLGISYKEVGENLKIKCPFHNDKNPSFSIKKDSGIWHCFSCKRSGNLFNLIQYFTGETGLTALNIIKNFEINISDEISIKNELIKRITKEGDTGYTVITPQYYPIKYHPYLIIKRKLTEEEIFYWNMGVVAEAPYKNWIIIPIYQDYKLQNYFLRSTLNTNKVFGNYPIQHIFFGLDSARDFNRTLYIVEGIFDLIFLRRIGLQVIASLTNRLYKPHIEILKQYKHIVIVPDNDDFGQGFELVNNALSLIYSIPKNSIPKVGVSLLPNNRKDAAECTLAELNEIPNREENILDFICKEVFLKWRLQKLHLQTLKK